MATSTFANAGTHQIPSPSRRRGPIRNKVPIRRWIPTCAGPTCAPHSAPLGANETGALYGANIIDQWTEVRAGGAIDLYWNVSTWDPYRVMLMKTRIAP